MDSTKNNELSKIKDLGETKIDLGFEPTIAFVPINNQELDRLVMFWSEKEQKLFKFEENGKSSENHGLNENDWKKVENKVFNNITSTINSKIIAILAQYSREDYNDGKYSDPGHGYIILFANGMSIQYCWTNNIRLSEQVLIQLIFFFKFQLTFF